MNENIDLTKILKDCPIGWKFYSSVYGEVEFVEIYRKPVLCNPSPREDEWLGQEIHDCNHPVRFWTTDGIEHSVSSSGEMIKGRGECTFFPSREQRDWSKFTAPWYKKLIESKFNVGQYITDGYVVGQITSIEDEHHCYKILDFMGGVSTTIPFTLQDNYHLWTITDAKDGDVLAKSWWEDKNLWEKIIIFKKYHSAGVVLYNVPCIEGYGSTFKNGEIAFTDIKVPYYSNTWTCNLHPATKEQRDLLFQKIKEAGYKWKNETKTLEKLIQPKFKVGDRVRHKETNMDNVYEISKVYDDSYGIAGFTWMIYMKYQDKYELAPNKFDPKMLKPFDKVLVKISNETFNTWYADFVAEPSHVKNETPLILGAKEANMVIPYNDETKHLVGTTEEAPEYYRYWEE